MKNTAFLLTLFLGCASTNSSHATDPEADKEASGAVTAASCNENPDCLMALERYCAKQQEYESSKALEVFHKGRLAYFLDSAGAKTARAPDFKVVCDEQARQ